MRQMATVMGRERVEVFLPKRSRLVRAARRAGFEQAAWGGAAVLYERANPLITMGVA